MSPRIALITSTELARTHGTGGQLLLTFDQPGIDYHHFHWRNRHGPGSETPRSFLLDQPFWSNDRLIDDQFNAFLRSRKLDFDVAHVVILQESEARRALNLVRALSIPYTVHLMDLFHADGITADATPAFHALLNGAADLLALTPPLAAAMQRATCRTPRLVCVGQTLTPHRALPPQPLQPLRIALTGRPYRGGCELLARALPMLRECCPAFELVYIGAGYNDLPESLRPHVRNMGYFNSEETYRPALATAHLAILTGPCEPDCLAQYSFPSRVADLLMAGLPTAAILADGCATQQLLSPLSPDAVAFISQPTDLAYALRRWSRSSTRWQAASDAARAFAQTHFDINHVRRQILAAIESARSPAIRAA